MTETMLRASQMNERDPQTLQLWMARSILGLAITTVGLMALGSATRVMNAGLSCPDWPLCYDSVFPASQMNLQVFLEWFHRVIATLVGLVTIGLTGLAWFWRRSLPAWAPPLVSLALLLVVFQGVLGGLTVTELLRFDIVTAHLGTGLAFFGTLLTIGCLLLPRTALEPVPLGNLRWFGLVAVGLVYGQSILGALVASQWALHQCFGTQQLCMVMNRHLLGIIPATVSTLVLVIVAMRHKVLPKQLRSLIHGTGMLLFCQLLIGFATFRLRLQVEPLTVAHQAIGALLLGSLIAFTVLTWRQTSYNLIKD
ncbi:MAG: heme A synthase [Synechococcales bacterium]|nr:heme A synthase [Synechococcales bacterium]